MLAGLPFHYSSLCAISQQAFLPFMNKHNAAKERTLTDVSVKSNAVGMFSSMQRD